MDSNVLTISLWILIFSIILQNIRSQETLDYREVHCEYSLTTGDQICDCRNRNRNFVLPSLNGNVNNLIVQNCKNLLVTQRNFQDVDHIEHIQFKNIQQLDLESYALEFKRRLPIPKIKLFFTNVNFLEIVPYSISGFVDSVTFDHCHIRKMNAYAIASVETVYSIAFENTEIDVLESQALKKMHIEHLTMRNSKIWSHVPSRAFSALTITSDIIISNCSFTTISSHAIELDDVNDFMFSNNKVDHFDGEAFHMNANGRISFERNNFLQFSHSALVAIQMGESVKQEQMEIRFASNEITSTDYPIRFDVAPKIYLRILDLKFPKNVDCDKSEELRRNGFLRQYADTVYFNFGKSSDVEYKSLSTILSNDCAESTYLIAIISTAVILTLVLSIVAVAIFYPFLMKRQPERQISMVIPDGKTYRETQIMIQIENAGLLKTNL